MNNPTTTNNDLLTVGYPRLSRDDKNPEGLSIPAQIRGCEEYAKRANLPPPTIIAEPKGVGGDIPFDKRPEGSKLWKFIETGKVAHVIVRDLDRLARSILIWMGFCKLCCDHGVTIHTFSGPVRDSSPTDRFSNNVIALTGQLEREQIGARIKHAKRQLAINGRQVGGPPAFGYMTQAQRKRNLLSAGVLENDAQQQASLDYPVAKRLYIYEPEAEVVRKIFRLYSEGKGTRQIATILRESGIIRPSGALWQASMVLKIIDNPVYCGFIPFKDAQPDRKRAATPKCDQTRYKGQHEAIISEEEWLNAQATKKRNTCYVTGFGDARKVNRRYPWSGVMTCGCGRTMSASSIDTRKNIGYYTCPKRRDFGRNTVGGCDRPRISISTADELVWPELGKMLGRPAVVEQLYRATQRMLEQRDRAKPAQSDIATKRQKIATDLAKWYERHDRATSDIEQEAAWTRILEVKLREKQLLEQLAQATPVVDVAVRRITRKQVEGFITDLATRLNGDPQNRVALVQLLVEHHGLDVRLVAANTLDLKLAFRPPGAGDAALVEYTVALESTVELPPGPIDAWFQEQNGKCICRICKKPITVNRHHYWHGLPKVHRECGLAESSQKRANPGGEFLNGMQAAAKLGIGRTTIGRWIKSGKLKPVEKRHGVWLFSKKAVNLLAAQAKKS